MYRMRDESDIRQEEIQAEFDQLQTETIDYDEKSYASAQSFIISKLGVPSKFTITPEAMPRLLDHSRIKIVSEQLAVETKVRQMERKTLEEEIGTLETRVSDLELKLKITEQDLKKARYNLALRQVITTNERAFCKCLKKNRFLKYFGSFFILREYWSHEAGEEFNVGYETHKANPGDKEDIERVFQEYFGVEFNIDLFDSIVEYVVECKQQGNIQAHHLLDASNENVIELAEHSSLIARNASVWQMLKKGFEK